MEESLISSKELSFIAIYSAFTAVSRIPFVGLPNIQPCSYLIFCAGFVFGPLIGFIVGVNTAIISNIFLGQGLFTLYQMIGWGLIGLVGGLIYFLYDQKHLNDYNRWILSTIGFILGFCYGWILNLSYWIMLPPPLTFKLFLGLCISSFYFDLLHGLSNFIFIFFFGNKTINILKRYRQRFLIVFKNKKIISERKKKEKIEN